MKLKREAFQKLTSWYGTTLRDSPCVLFGPRQVGKSTLALDFAISTGRDVISVNFWKDPDGIYQNIFVKNSTANKIISSLEIILNRDIDPKRSILVLDEIQECPVTYSLCKTFKEDTSLPVIATGSYLKLLLYGDSELEIPVGCTHEYLVTPLTYAEYLMNCNVRLFQVYDEAKVDKPLETLHHNKLLEVYYEYLFTGGMPEAVSTYLEHRDNNLRLASELTRAIHNKLLSGYRNDFLTFRKHKIITTSRAVAEKLAYTFETIPKELAKYWEAQKPVQRFRFSSLGKNAEYRRVSNIFQYLSLCGLIIKSHVVKDCQFPLLVEDDSRNAFKCFYFDVGILQAALHIPYNKIVKDELSHYKGALAENFVAQQIFSYTNDDLFSWKPDHYHEVEFLLARDEIIPIEVKSSKKPSATPSLDAYIKKYKPQIAIKIAPRNFGRMENKLSIPIYFIGKLPSSVVDP